jgi:hypothetical protein
MAHTLRHKERLMKTVFGRSALVLAAALTLGVAVDASAQATQTKERVAGTGTVSKTQLQGEVVSIKGDSLVAKMSPSGDYRLFSIAPGKTATIDGKVMPLNQVSPGTKLTADVYTTQTPVTERTTTTLNGTVWYASPTTVILTLENGENRQYEVPAGLKFDVDGQMKEAMELRPGMKVHATKVVESPTVIVRQDSVVTGTTK